MMTRRAIVGMSCALALSGCFGTIPEQASRGDAALARAAWEDADADYASAMAKPLSFDEFDYIVAQRCHARRQLTSQQLAALAPSAVTFEAIASLRAYARKCPGFEATEEALTALEIDLAQRTFNAKVVPLVEAGALYEALHEAAALTPHLPASHPRASWLEQEVRARIITAYQARAAQLPEGSLAHSVLLTLISLARAQRPELAALAPRAEAVVGVRPEQPQARVSVEGACGALLGDAVSFHTSSSTPQGALYRVEAGALTGCSISHSVDVIAETFTTYRTELREVKEKVITKIPVRTANTTVTRACGQTAMGFSGCRTVATKTTYATQTVTREEYVTVKKEVQVPVVQTRKLKQVTQTLSAHGWVSASVSGELVRQPVEATVSVTVGTYPLDSPDAQLIPSVTTAPGQAALGQAIAASLSSAALRAARGARMVVLAGELDYARAVGDRAPLVELIAALWLGGAALTPEQLAPLSEALGLQLSGPWSPDALPSAPAFAWLDTALRDDFFAHEPDLIAFGGLLARGYPFMMSGVAASYQLPPQQLVGQPARSGLMIGFEQSLRWTFATGDHHQGLGLMIGGDLAAGMGRRFGDDYQRVEPLPIYARDESETRYAVGAQLGAAAMVGFRHRRFGLFAGLKPTFTLGLMGYYRSQGGAIPMMGRVEVRHRDRYPLIVEAWYGDLSASARDAWGAALDLPVAESLWLRLSAQRQQPAAQLYGLNEADRVYLDRAPQHTVSVGLMLAP